MTNFAGKRRRAGLAVLLGVAAVVLTSCNYGHRPFQQTPLQHMHDLSNVDVEMDDFGNFWDRTKAESILNAIDDSAANSNVVVLLFVHGWHHNAADDDTNRNDFHITVKAMDDKLKEKIYQDARTTLKIGGDVKVVGVYLSWRGESLPGFLDYSTFWGRKAAAERVGDGAAREFIFRLNEIYKKRNQSDQQHFMGLVSIGHSFGGQVLYKSVEAYLEDNFLLHEGQPAQMPVAGVGDVAVLINPAFEAAQFDRLRALQSRYTYSPAQTPVLLVFSGEGDWARQWFFPVGRRISAWFRPAFSSDEKKAEWITALGEYEPQRTHSLKLQPNTASYEFSKDYCRQALGFDLTNPGVPFADATLAALPGRSKQFSPFVVAYSENELIEAHNGIFKGDFRRFLIDYVALLEGKRLCLKAQSFSPSIVGGYGPTY
ncbi:MULTISPECIES: hypothetical protein [unclassified Pseudomonas]|uniref:hypothetical protein n=1 Tax=unclassified Pseudomonas TaxID=196821 RepID=UPI002AC9D4A8|nr:MULTISPECIES: hypothetical protein [unclassified Pseudomonas]MEB0039331.1 hypothetical protein [Pseudomonas sp. MH10]MEB0119770.1 hypothetical protein [Pseudomonas sp. CCI1.2]WPX64938.1 hypothetical protein RHM59_04380 [Pseudomonas sp. MH10]